MKKFSFLPKSRWLVTIIVLFTLCVNQVWGETATLTITRNDFSGSGGYNWYTWTVGDYSGQAYIYATTTASMQFNGSKSGRTLFNSTPLPGRIVSIKMTKASGSDRGWVVRGGTTTNDAPTTSSTNTYGTAIGSALSVGTQTWSTTDGTDYRYFLLYENVTSASYISEVVVTYETGGGCSAPTSPSISGTTSYTAGQTISLEASATGTDASTTYQWYKGDPDNGGTSQGDASTSGAIFTKASCVVGDAGTYYCVISNGTGCTAKASQTITVSAPSYTVVWTINPAAGGTLSATSGTSTTVTPNSAYTYGDPAYTVTTGTATVSQSTNTFSATPTANCSIRINMVEKPKYTITYNAGTGTCATSSEQITSGQSTTLPSASPSAGCSANDWEFAGWCTSSAGNEDENTTSPGDILTGSYTPTGNITLYAVYTKSGGGGSATLTKMVTGNTLSDGDKLVVVANGTDIAMYQETTNSSYVQTWDCSTLNATSVSSDDKNWWTVTATTGGFYLGDATNGYLNMSSNNLYCNANQSVWTLADLEDGTFKLQSNSRNLSYRNDLATTKWRMGGASYGTSGQTVLDLYKYSAGGGTTYYMTSLACSSCSYTVTLSKGSETNGTFTMTPAAGTRNNCTTGLVVTVSDISPNSGYEFVEVTESNGITPTDNGDGTYTITYTADQSYTSTVGVTFRQLCATPTFTPGAGTYTSSQNVTISCATNEAVIHYTTDGSTPTASSPTYNGAITVSEDMTIKAIATKANYGNSEVASASYKILDCDWYESFDDADGSGGNDDTWSGSAGTDSFTPDKNGWTFSTSNCGADQCIKVGTGSAGGSAQTPVLTGLTGNLILTFRAAGWNGESPTVTISSSTSGSSVSPSSVSVTEKEWNSYEVAILNVTTATQITFSCDSKNNRFFLDDVCVKQGSSTFSVTYNANSGSGTAPTDNTEYDRNSSVTVSGNTNLTKTGWTFAGWNTAADGSGTPYAAGNTFSITSNVTLYAMWTCTVTWSVNENTSACSPETITYDPSGNKVETVPTPDPSNYCGDVFVGWYTADCDSNTAPDGTFTNVAGSPNITGNTTFYAVFADFVAE